MVGDVGTDSIAPLSESPNVYIPRSFRQSHNNCACLQRLTSPDTTRPPVSPDWKLVPVHPTQPTSSLHLPGHAEMPTLTRSDDVNLFLQPAIEHVGNVAVLTRR